MALNNLKALMKEETLEPGEKKPGFLKKKPGMTSEPKKMSGLAARLTGKK